MQPKVDQKRPQTARSVHASRTGSNDKNVDEPVPARLGRYEVRRLIDSDGFGAVYLAYDETLERHVAIKVPHHSRISRPKDVEAYLVEARIVPTLQPGCRRRVSSYDYIIVKLHCESISILLLIDE